MKKCPDCGTEFCQELMVCDCGYDFTKMDCPGCDSRIPDDSVICPHCKYDLVGEHPVGRRKIKPIEKSRTITTQSPVGTHKSKVYVPATFRMTDWHELKFHGPETDAGLLAWAEKLRRRADQDNDWLSNHAVSYVAETSGNRYLEINCLRLRELLGGDDWN